MALIDDIKVAVRLSSNDEGLVGELEDLMGAALLDLKTSGIREEFLDPNQDLDLLIKAAVKLYVKTNWGFDNPDSEKFRAAYFELKAQLALTTEYRKEIADA